MKTRYFYTIFLAVFLFAGIASIGFAQSNNCTVMENQGGLVTVSCPGEGPKVINMGGSADIYKPGDPYNGYRANKQGPGCETKGPLI